MTLKDCWKVPYFNDDGSVNPECRLFAGISEENKNKYLQEANSGIGFLEK